MYLVLGHSQCHTTKGCLHDGTGEVPQISLIHSGVPEARSASSVPSGLMLPLLHVTVPLIYCCQYVHGKMACSCGEWSGQAARAVAVVAITGVRTAIPAFFAVQVPCHTVAAYPSHETKHLRTRGFVS